MTSEVRCGLFTGLDWRGMYRAPECRGTLIQMNDDWWRNFTNEVLEIGLWAVNVTLIQFGQGWMSDNLMKGVNSVRCALTSGFENSWMLIASLYYFAATFGYESDIKSFFGRNYPYICTCTLEIRDYNERNGIDPAKMEDLGFCSEKARSYAAFNRYQEANSNSTASS